MPIGNVEERILCTPSTLIIQTYGTLLDCENEYEQDTVSLEEYAPALQVASAMPETMLRGHRR